MGLLSSLFKSKKKKSTKTKSSTKKTYIGKGGVKSSKGKNVRKNAQKKSGNKSSTSKSKKSASKSAKSKTQTKAKSQYKQYLNNGGTQGVKKKTSNSHTGKGGVTSTKGKSARQNAQKNTKNSVRTSAQKAYEKGKNVTYLGTKQKTTTTTLGKSSHKTGRGTGKNETLKSVNALTKNEFNRMTEAQRLGKKTGDTLLKGSKRTGQKDIREKVGSKTAESAYKSKAATGVMRGMSKADIFSNSVGTYNKEAKKAIKKTKKSVAYNIGYGAGMAADMAMGGIGSKGASAAKLTGKAASKIASKVGAKAATKAGTKVAKEAGEKAVKKQAVKTLAKNRAGELVAETPSNVLDAAKMATDTEGNIDKDEMVKYIVINSGLTVGMGGAIEKIAGAITKSQAIKAVRLLGKQKAGKLTAEESEELGKLVNKIKKKANSSYENTSSVYASDAKGKIKEDAEATRLARKVEQSIRKGEEMRTASATARAESKETAEREARTAQTKSDFEAALIEESRMKANQIDTAYEKNVQEAANDVRSYREIEAEKSRINQKIEELEKYKAVQKEGYRGDTERQIASLKKELENLKEEEKALYRAKLSKQKYGDLTSSEASLPQKGYFEGENQPVSAGKKPSDTVTPKTEESPSKVAESPSTATPKVETPATAEAFAKYAKEDGTIDIEELPENLREAVLKESKEVEDAAEKATQAAFSKYVRTHPAYKDFKEAEDLRKEWDELMESIPAKDGIPQATVMQEKRISEIQDRFEELGYNFDPSVGDFAERRNLAMREAYEDFLGTDEYKSIWSNSSSTDSYAPPAEGESSIDILKDLYSRRAEMATRNGYNEGLERRINTLEDELGIERTDSGTIVDPATGETRRFIGTDDNESMDFAAQAAEYRKQGVKAEETAAETAVKEADAVVSIKKELSEYRAHLANAKKKGSDSVPGLEKDIADAEERLKTAAVEDSPEISEPLKTVDDAQSNLKSLQEVKDDIDARFDKADYSPKKQAKIMEEHDEVMSRMDDEVAKLREAQTALEEEKRTIMRYFPDLKKGSDDYAVAEAKLDAINDALGLSKKEAKEPSLLNFKNQSEAVQNQIKESKAKRKEMKARMDEIDNELRTAETNEERLDLQDELKELKKAYSDAERAEKAIMMPDGTMEDLDAMAPQVKTNKERHTKSSLKARASKAHSKGMTTLVDSLHGLEETARRVGGATGKKLNAAINSFRTAHNKGEGWVTQYRTDLNGNKTGKSLNDIYKPFVGNKKAQKEAEMYCFHMHNIDRYQQGKPIFGENYTSEYSRLWIAEHNTPQNIKFQREMKDYFRDQLKYSLEAGDITAEQYAKMTTRYPNYVPSYRALDFLDGIKKVPDEIAVDDGIRLAKGGDYSLISLYDQAVSTTMKTIKNAQENKMFEALADAMGTTGRALDDGMTAEDLVNTGVVLGSKSGDNTTYTASFFSHGKYVTMDIDETIYHGMRQWNKDEMAAVLNWKGTQKMSKAVRVFKGLCTDWNIIFGIKNAFRDQATAVAYTKDIKGYVKAWPKALMAITNKNSVYRKYLDDYLANGGKWVNLVDQEKTLSIPSKWEKLKPWEQVSRINSAIETFPRLAEYMSTIDRLGGLGKATKSTRDIAMHNANDLTLNFGRSGIITKTLNAGYVPYINPSIQGLDKLARTFREPKTFRGYLNMGMKVAAVPSAFAVGNELLMQGNEAYQRLSERDKNSNFYMPCPWDKDILFKLPKARELAVVAEPFEYVMRYMQFNDGTADKPDWKQLFESAIDNIGVVNPLESNLFSPIMRLATNKTWYGTNIESIYEQDTPVKDRYDESTSAVAIVLANNKIAEGLGLSPKKIDTMIDGYLGVVGDMIISSTSQEGKYNPLFKGFFQDTLLSNKESGKYWDKYTELEQAKNDKSLSKKEKAKAEKAFNDFDSAYGYDVNTLNAAITEIDTMDKSNEWKLNKKRQIKEALATLYNEANNGKASTVNVIRVISKTLGYDTAFTNYAGESTKYESKTQKAWKTYKKSAGWKDLSKKEQNKLGEDFLKVYSTAKKYENQVNGDTKSPSDYVGVAIAAQRRADIGDITKKSARAIQNAYGVSDDNIENAKIYTKNGGTMKTWVTTEKAMQNGVDNLEAKAPKASTGASHAKAMILAENGKVTFKDRAYFIETCDYKMNASRCLTQKKYGWSSVETGKLALKIDTDGNGYYKKDEIIAAIEKSRAKTTEEKCALFELYANKNTNNPYGTLKDYSIKGDTGLNGASDTSSSSGGSSGGYGYRRRGYGGGGGGGSSGGSSKDWYSFYKSLNSDVTKASATAGKRYSGNRYSSSSTGSGSSVQAASSPLDEALRRRLRKMYANVGKK